METVEYRFRVKGMKCGGCVAKATAAVSQLPGYQKSSFDLPSGTAVVNGNLEPQIVIAALKQAGYPAELIEN